MKFFRYKQVARLIFSGIDDELNDVDSSYYNTKQKLFDNNGSQCQRQLHFHFF